MGRKKTIVQEEGRELIKSTDPITILNLCKSITYLDLKSDCPMDLQYAQTWYQNHYLTKKHARYVMKQGESIHHYKDGVVYRAHNITDAKAEQLMLENPEYKKLFVDLGPVKEDVEETPSEPLPEPDPTPDKKSESETNTDSNTDQTPEAEPTPDKDQESDTESILEGVNPDSEKEEDPEEVKPEAEVKE